VESACNENDRSSTTQDSQKVQTTWQKIYRKTTEKMEEQLVGTTAINLVQGEEGERELSTTRGMGLPVKKWKD
jgi:hypothetical protein